MTPGAGLRRGHSPIEHTADVGLRASAADLAGLFEEAALALAEIAADAPRPAPAEWAMGGLVCERIALEAPDLAALAFAWLNELIGLADASRSALISAAVETVVPDRAAVAAGGPAGRDRARGGVTPGGWRLAATACFVPFGPGVRPRLGVKSATYHGLAVDGGETGWTLTAYLDV